MGFSSFASYLDPSNWLQQQSTGSSSNGDPQLSSTPLAPPPPPPPLPHQAVGGAGSVRPGSLADRARMANLMPEPALKCPRCESTSTKFCYFNNYSLSQPRHFCKTCRRYWTKGGALRNVPVGGGCRRNKRSKSGSKSMSNAAQKAGCSASTGTAPLPSNDTTGSSTADSLISLMPPPSRFLAPFHHLADYGGAAAEMGLSYGGILAASPGSTSEDIHMNIPLGSISNLLGGGGGGGSYLPAGGGDQWRLQQQQQQHAAAGIQNFPFMGSGGLANGMEPPAMGLYPLDGVEARGGSGGGFDLAGLVGVRQGKTSAVASSSSSSSSVLSQLASVKIEDSTKRDLNNLSSSSTSRQYLLGNINNQYWIDGAAGGSRGSGAAAWTDLSGFSSSSATGSNPL